MGNDVTFLESERYVGVSKSSQTTSTDRQPMALCECMRYAWEQGTLPHTVPSGVAVWTLGVAQHECCHHVCRHICDFSMDVKLEQRANSANPERRLLKCYDVHMEMRPCVVRHVSSGMHASREAEHHSKTTRGQDDLPRAQPLKMWKQFGGLCMRIIGEQLRRLPSSTAVFFAVWGRTFGGKDLNCGARAIGCSMMTTHPLTELSQCVSFSPTTTLPHFRIRLTLQIWPLATSSCSRDEADAKGSPIWWVGGHPAGIAECAW